MFFIKVPEGTTVKNRTHLDLAAADRHTEVARFVDL
ncbi:MAG: VOC family protein, partial [Tabrizicola sp.]|nr:VOC family protein [Tabrizicola sp.]